MNATTLRRIATAVALSAGLTTASGAFALDDLKIIAPAKPGGGWDQTARVMQEVMQEPQIAEKWSSPEIENLILEKLNNAYP